MRRKLVWIIPAAILGIVLFGITSVLCAAAPDGTTLILARGLQGEAA